MVAGDNVYGLACFLLKSLELCGYVVVLLPYGSAVVCKVAGDKKKFNRVILCALTKKLVDDSTALVIHSGTS